MKNKTTALVLAVFVGTLGVDRFYLGYIGLGILKLLTAGCFGVLWLIDIINIATGRLKPADGSNYEDDNKKNMVNTQSCTYNAYDDLEKLAKLHEQGVVTDEEFAVLKADCLSRM